jgi:hypothetical protein
MKKNAVVKTTKRARLNTAAALASIKFGLQEAEEQGHVKYGDVALFVLTQLEVDGFIMRRSATAKPVAAIGRKYPAVIAASDIFRFCAIRRIGCTPTDAMEVATYLRGKRTCEEFDRLSSWARMIVDDWMIDSMTAE